MSLWILGLITVDLPSLLFELLDLFFELDRNGGDIAPGDLTLLPLQVLRKSIVFAFNLSKSMVRSDRTRTCLEFWVSLSTPLLLVMLSTYG